MLFAASSARRMLFLCFHVAPLKELMRSLRQLIFTSSLSEGRIMRNNYFLRGVGLTLVGTLCLSLCTAAPPTQSSSLGPLIPRIASDAVGFDSGLWRSEYLQQPKQDKDKTKVPPSEVMPNKTTSDPVKSTPTSFRYSENLITIPLNTSSVIDTQIHQADGESTIQEETTMSEWDNAVSESTASVTPGSTASGPSITSAIVGFVGIMIVIGAYVSSGKRNR